MRLNSNKVYYSPTNAQVIKIYNKIAPTCFGAVTPSSGSSFLLADDETLLTVLTKCNFSKHG